MKWCTPVSLYAYKKILLWYKNTYHAHFSPIDFWGQKTQPLTAVHCNKKCSFQLLFLQYCSLNMQLNKRKGARNAHLISLIMHPFSTGSQCLDSCEPSPRHGFDLLSNMPARPTMQMFAPRTNFIHMVNSGQEIWFYLAQPEGDDSLE